MSLLVRYTLNSSDHHDTQIAAMRTLVDGLKSEGIAGLNYSCFSTDQPTEFIGVLEYPDDAAKQGFLESKSFATYRDTVGPIFANPPQPTEIQSIASTRD
jgi:quinol monooxygenase YgiN